MGLLSKFWQTRIVFLITGNADTIYNIQNRNGMTDRNRKLGNTANLLNCKEIDNNRKGVRQPKKSWALRQNLKGRQVWNMYKLFGWIINRIRKQVRKLILIRFLKKLNLQSRIYAKIIIIKDKLNLICCKGLSWLAFLPHHKSLW